MNIWILQTGEPLHCDNENFRPMRAVNLANSLVARGHSVVIWSSSFFHQKKKHRSFSYKEIKVNERILIRLVPSPGYIKNIGLARLFDHAVLAFRLSRLLKSNKWNIPDVAFIGYPPIEFAAVAGQWLRSNKVPTMLDVKDLWPTLFVEAFPVRLQPVVRILLFPYFFIAKKTFKSVTALCTMSSPYLEWMLEFSGRDRTSYDTIVPLTVDNMRYSESEIKDAVCWWREKVVGFQSVPVVSFVGSFMSVYDFQIVREASLKLKEAGTPCIFVLAGDGGFLDEIKILFDDCDNVIFPGWIDGPKIRALYQNSSCALIPYKNIENYTLNTPNKVLDALANSVPIVTSLSGEVANLIHEHEIGIECNDTTDVSFYDAIKYLIDNPEIQSKMSQNCVKLYNARFSFESTYGNLVDGLERLAKENLSS